MRGLVGSERSSSGGLFVSFNIQTCWGLTPRFDHPDDTELTRMGFTCLGISNDLKEVGHGKRDSGSAYY
jgi:hypothetical protein